MSKDDPDPPTPPHLSSLWVARLTDMFVCPLVPQFDVPFFDRNHHRKEQLQRAIEGAPEPPNVLCLATDAASTSRTAW